MLNQTTNIEIKEIQYVDKRAQTCVGNTHETPEDNDGSGFNFSSARETSVISAHPHAFKNANHVADNWSIHI